MPPRLSTDARGRLLQDQRNFSKGRIFATIAGLFLRTADTILPVKGVLVRLPRIQQGWADVRRSKSSRFIGTDYRTREIQQVCRY
jgi:hypothetical protein